MSDLLKKVIRVFNINSDNKNLSERYIKSLHENGVMDTVAERNAKIRNIVNIHCSKAYNEMRRAI